MKKLLSLLLALSLVPAFARADAVIFSGNDVKTLKPNIDLFGRAKILSGAVDPSTTATTAPRGSIYLNTSIGALYSKTDNGSSTNWTLLGAGGSGLNQLTGEVTAGPGSGSQAATLSNAAVIGKLLTGYAAAAGTVASTDSILAGIQKLDGNLQLAATAISGKQAGPLTGDVGTISASNTATTIQPGVITTAKIADLNVTDTKMADNSIPLRAMQTASVNGNALTVGAVDLASSKVTGVAPVVKGGTGSGTQQGAINALSGLTTKGDQLVHDGTNAVRLAACANDQLRIADSTQASGYRCGPATLSLTANDKSIALIPSAGFGTVTGASYWVSRAGDRARFHGYLKAGTPAASVAYMQLPSGMTIDASKYAAGVTQRLGDSDRLNISGTATNNNVVNQKMPMFYDGSTNNQIFFSTQLQTGAFVKANASDFLSANDALSFDFTVTIAEWAQGTTVNIFDAGDYGWTSYAPTITGFGTITASEFEHKRVGDSIWIRGRFASGTASAVEARITLPGTLLTGTYANSASIGRVTRGVANAGSASFSVIPASSQNYFNIGSASASFSPLSPRNGSEIANSGDVFVIEPTQIKIQGWSTFPFGVSGINQEIGAQATAASSYAATANSPIIFPTIKWDTGNVYNTSNGRFTAPVAGRYNINCFGFQPSGNAYLQAYINGVAQNTLASVLSANVNSASGDFVMAANDYLTVAINGSFTLNVSSVANNAFAPACTFKKVN